MADSYYLFYLLYVVVAQLAEHLTFNQDVEGSNPSHHTIIRSLSSDGLEQWPSKPQVAGSIPAVTTIIQGCSLSGKRTGLINRRQLVQIQSSLPYTGDQPSRLKAQDFDSCIAGLNPASPAIMLPQFSGRIRNL